ncbi:MAG: phosphoadenylyl-sulfate reductase [Dehalococcoidia bacterium]|nr:MAG: phosphoadenylyl-sulfate reductase [Dehalococcoidia bacterium]
MTEQLAEAETAAEMNAAARELEAATPQEILAWAAQRYQPGLALACSFGGPSGMVLLDMVMAIDRSVEVFYLDTDFLFPETYKLRDVAAARYGFEPVGYMSLLTREQQAQRHGDELWARDPDACCAIRKVEPNRRALAGKTAWISGIRRDQTKHRATTPIVEWDERFGLVKVNPLATWSEAQVWKYIVENGVPYNELHDRGYPSIGCTYCTNPVRPGDDPRSGRWQGREKVECGLHVPVPATGLVQGVAWD